MADSIAQPANDPQQPVASDPTASAVGSNSGGAQADDQKSPLDILEQLLKDSKKDEAASDQAASPQTPGLAAPGGEESAQPAALTPEQIAELDAKLAAQREIDQQKVEQTLSELNSVKTSPQYQARVQQQQQEDQEKQEEAVEHDGHQIRQVSHTKI